MDKAKILPQSGFSRHAVALGIGLPLLLAMLSVAILVKKSGSNLSGAGSKAQSAQIRVAITNNSETIKKLCFVRYESQGPRKWSRNWIYLKDSSSGKETKLVEGTQPDLSPAGNEVAFNGGKIYDGPPGFADPISREGRVDPARLKVLNLRTNEIRDFSSLASLHSYHPLWSSDGTKIAFVMYGSDGTKADIGVVDQATGEWKNLTKSLDLGFPPESIYLDSWVPGEQSVLLHTMENIYELGLDGVLVQKISTTALGISTSDTRFLLSSDKGYLVFNRTDEISHEPAEVIYRLDLSTNKLSRITPESIDAMAPVWLPSGKEIIFTCSPASKNTSGAGICKIAIDGTGLTTLVRNADSASYSPR